jgi:GAF domain-containing protein
LNGPLASPKALLTRSQWVFLVVSIVPLLILTWICVQYVFPVLGGRGQGPLVTSIYITLGLTVALSVLGYIVSRRSAISAMETIQGQNRRLAELLELADSLNQPSALETTLGEGVRSATRILGADAGLIYLLEENRLVYRGAAGLREPPAVGSSLRMGEGPAGEALRSKRSVRIAEAGEGGLPAEAAPEPETARGPHPLTGRPTGPVLACPLLSQERRIGALEVIRRRGAPPFDESDRQTAEILGRMIAAALADAEHREAQQNYFVHVTELLRLALEKQIAWEGHLQNVTRCSDLVSRRLGLSDESRRDIHFAALLHDIGFLALGQTKGRAETDEQWAAIREHPRLGAKFLQPITVWKNVAPLVLYHHELCDGSGYPEGLVNRNSYTGGRTREQAAAELRAQAGIRYDERVVEAFLEMLAEEGSRAR